MDDKDSKTELLEIMKDGVPEIINRPNGQVVVSVREEDSVEVTAAKRNIQFVVDSATDAIQLLSILARENGSPKFFEAMSSMLRVLNDASAQLIKLEGTRSSDDPKVPPSSGTFIQNNDNRQVNMTTEQLQKVISGEADIEDMM